MRSEFNSIDGAMFWVGKKIGQNHEVRLTTTEKIQTATILRDIVGNPFRSVESLWKKLQKGAGLVLENRPGKYQMRLANPGEEINAILADDEISPDGTVKVYPAYTTGYSKSKMTTWEALPAVPAVPWVTQDVITLSERAYQDLGEDGTLDPLTLAAVADALEEAGCDNKDILYSLRGWERHRECLGKGGYLVTGKVECLNSLCTGWVLPSSLGPKYRGFWPIDVLTRRE